MGTESASANTPSLVILLSGNGSNLQAIIDQVNAGSLHARISAVIANKADAFGLQRAKAAGIPAIVLSHRSFPDRASFDRALQSRIDHYQPDLVILAGFMRILTPPFVRHYQGRLLNIHPSLLPRYRGLHTHRRVLEAGDREHGVTVHFVTEELDGGPNILQALIGVRPDSDEQELARRIHRQEHRIYPRAIKWFLTGRLHFKNNRAILDHKALPPGGYLVIADPDE